MEQKSFAVLGDTVSEGKPAFMIKERMRDKGYKIFPVGKELLSINEIEEDIDIIDVCMNPKKALELLKENRKAFKCVLLQPGTEGEELICYLDEKNIPYLKGCLLKGLKEYK